MSSVTIMINGRGYRVGCADGQERRVQELAAMLDQRVEQVARREGQVGETRLLLLASLMLADELAEAQERPDNPRSSPFDANDMAQSLEILSRRIETIAARLEHP